MSSTLNALEAPWAAAGVYVPWFCGGRCEHELSLKIRHSKASREHDRDFAGRLLEAVAWRFPGFAPDVIASVPARPGGDDRFRHIRRQLASHVAAADGEAALKQTRTVEGYRQMTSSERWACCPGRFVAHDCVRGKSVLLIDDVITSGAQASEATRALREAGAWSVCFAALAVATAAQEDSHDLGPPMRARSESHVSYDGAVSERVVVEVTAVEGLAVDAPGSRRALVRWSDGTTGEALRWYDDLSGPPHKSSYADSGVMPRRLRRSQREQRRRTRSIDITLARLGGHRTCGARWRHSRQCAV